MPVAAALPPPPAAQHPPPHSGVAQATPPSTRSAGSSELGQSGSGRRRGSVSVHRAPHARGGGEEQRQPLQGSGGAGGQQPHLRTPGAEERQPPLISVRDGLLGASARGHSSHLGGTGRCQRESAVAELFLSPGNTHAKNGPHGHPAPPEFKLAGGAAEGGEQGGAAGTDGSDWGAGGWHDWGDWGGSRRRRLRLL